MEMSPFGIATSLMGRVGRGERNKPKAYSKIVTRDRVESNNTWREEGGDLRKMGGGVYNVPNSFNLHCRELS